MAFCKWSAYSIDLDKDLLLLVEITRVETGGGGGGW
jgi:hypothetical protein